MYLSILIPSIFALYTLYKNKITFPGILLAWIIGVIIAYYGDWYAYSALATTFILTIVSDKIKKTKKDKTRDIYQIISNVLPSGLCIVLYALTDNNLFYTMFYAVIAASLSDTLASSIGTLSKKKPINIFTLEKMETGASGGVSFLGTLISLLGGTIIGAIYLIKVFDLKVFIFISLFGLIGSLLDSIMGILLQAQYRCMVCRQVVETRKHCRHKTKLISGYNIVDNNLVNLLSNIIVLVFSYIIL